jgi:galactose mutarotase-like enzyme
VIIREENKRGQKSILLENDKLIAFVIPDMGGKIAGLYCKNERFELVAQPKAEYIQPEYGSDFSLFDASGLDDGFPCLHALKDPVTGFDYPDHGEIWSARFSAHIQDDGVEMRYDSRNFPYRYTKKISLSGSRLAINYHIVNTGADPFPCIWAFHGLMRYEEDMELLYPAGCSEIINTLSSPLLGPEGRRHFLGGPYDFRHPPAPQPPTMIKYYFADKMQEGQCGFWYPGKNVGCMLRYDYNILPWLGVWITAGGFRGDYNCALEPCNGFYDDIVTARSNNALYTLEPGAYLSFGLALNIFNQNQNQR